MRKEATLFDLTKKQTLLNAVVYYIIMFVIYFIFHMFVYNAFINIYATFHPEISSNTYNENVQLGYFISSHLSLITFPLCTLLFSAFFFIKKNLYRMPMAYILTAIGIFCPPVIGFVFISFLSLLMTESKIKHIEKEEP